MTILSVRKADLLDVTTVTLIRNDAHATKVAHCDYAWGKEGDGFSERWVRNNISAKDVYVVELEGTAVGTFSLALDHDNHWGCKNQSPVMCMGFLCGKASTDAGLAAPCLIGAPAR